MTCGVETLLDCALSDVGLSAEQAALQWSVREFFEPADFGFSDAIFALQIRHKLQGGKVVARLEKEQVRIGIGGGSFHLDHLFDRLFLNQTEIDSFAFFVRR